MNDNNMNNGFNNVNPNVNNDNNQLNNINSNNLFWNNDVNQNNVNNIGYNQSMSNSIENVNNNVNNINSIDQVQGVNPQMMNVVQDMGMNQQVNSNVVSNQDMNNNQNINVAENFLNVIKENTNDNVMISNSMDMNNNNLGSVEAVSDTFNMNNIDVSQINNSIQNDVNNVNQVQEVNNVNQVQDMVMNQQVNNVVDNQNVMSNIANVNDSFGNVNMVNNSVNSVDNNVNQNLMVDNNNQVNNQSVNNDINSNVDEELVRVYVGEKYDKIKNSSFSLPTFFLGSLYLFYRKMYLYGWLMMLLGPLSFIGFIILAIKFKDVYLKDVSKKVNKIKLKNSNLSNEELKNICSKKGGTSIGGVLLNTFGIFVVLIVIVILLTFVLGASMFAMIFGALGSGNVEIKPSINNGQDVIMDDSSEDDSYDYVDDSYDDNNSNQSANGSCEQLHKAIEYNKIFDITIPENFFESEYSRSNYLGKEYSHYEYYYNKKDNIFQPGSCYFSLQEDVSNSASNAKDLAVYRKDCQRGSEIKEVTIKNINWYTLEYEGFGTNYIYITEKDGNIYEFQYNINEEKDYEYCRSVLDKVINSIKFK